MSMTHLRQKTFAPGHRVGAIAALGLCTTLAWGTATFGQADAQVESNRLSVEGLILEDDHPHRSPLALATSEDGRSIHVINHTGRSLDAVDAETGTIQRTVALAAAPSGLVLDAERDLLYVTRGLDRGAIDVIQAAEGRILRTVSAGHTPVSPVLSPDGGTLYVANRFDHEVAAYDAESGEARARVSVVREPIALALTPDGHWLVAAQHLPAQPSNSERVAARVDIMDAESFTIAASVILPNGSTSVRDVCISPDGKYAYVTHTLGRFHLPTTQLERGWMNTSAMSILDLEEKEWRTTVLLDDVDRGAANPWGVACTPDGARIVVAHSGTHEVSVIDRTVLHDKIDRVAAGEAETGVARSLEEIPNDLTFLVGLRQRVDLPGNGPRGLAMGDGEVIVAEYFSDSLAHVKLDGAGRAAVEQLALGEPVEPDPVRQGEIAFHDAQLCFQNWQSCASCHPDVRVDALNWDLLNDGIGNPKNTRTMLFTHYTPPVMITGIRDSADVAVRAGFRFIQFVTPPDEVTAAVDEYLKALVPVPSPYRVEGELSEAALRGRDVFAQARCDTCHSGEYYTDGKKYDVGTGPDELGIRTFVTPPLNEVWRTAPYLFDGRAATIREVFDEHNPDDQHGVTSTLTQEQLADLVEYVLSL